MPSSRSSGRAVLISSQLHPTSTQSPYLVSANSHVTVESLIDRGGSGLGGYKMVGIPDGLGAFDNGNGTFTVLMNHEFGSNPGGGAVRAHGANGRLRLAVGDRQDDAASRSPATT